MKAIIFFIISSVLLLKKEDSYAQQPGFVVIELFSSEGCSSCPPADALIARIQGETKNQPVYILSFQVDYWDRLGWKDPYSSSQFSNRQRQYAGWLHLSSIYTPQIVVNGTKEFVGSDERLLRKNITDCLQKHSAVQLMVNGKQQNKSTLDLNYEANGMDANASLIIAFVQPSGTSHIKKGENSGRTIEHVQIVRSYQTIALKDKVKNKSRISMDIPKNIPIEGTELIALLQNNSTGEILAATKVGLILL